MPPLLFMGEEWGAITPFPFFCDFHETLAEAVRNGRRAEFKSAYAEFGDEIPDSLAAETFRSAVLDWDARTSARGHSRLTLVRELLATRREEVVPRLAGAIFEAGRSEGTVLNAHWRLGDYSTLYLIANLSAKSAPGPHDAPDGRPLWGGPLPETLPRWSVFWSIGAG
jgi:maltooligosyltrehalose trehalohydrolase